MPSRILLFTFATAFLLLSFGSGCSRKLVPVEGVVRWEDGKPVTSASLRFIPLDEKGRESAGYTGKEGEFTLSSYSSDDGSFPGEYKVVITKFGIDASMPPKVAVNGEAELAKMMKEWWENQQAKRAKVTDPVPAVYGDEKTTPLRWKIESGGAKIELKINRK